MQKNCAMKIELTLKAQNDLSDIWDYTCEQWSIAQAEKYIRNIWKAIESLKSPCNPSQNISFVRAGYRKLQPGSHVIFFKLSSESITVIRVLHQQMDIAKHLSGES